MLLCAHLFDGYRSGVVDIFEIMLIEQLGMHLSPLGVLWLAAIALVIEVVLGGPLGCQLGMVWGSDLWESVVTLPDCHQTRDCLRGPCEPNTARCFAD
jgi:hypothetical protein